jgi:hypothetical protein
MNRIIKVGDTYFSWDESTKKMSVLNPSPLKKVVYLTEEESKKMLEEVEKKKEKEKAKEEKPSKKTKK